MEIKRALIVSPASMKYAWKSEVEKWSDLSCVVIDSKTDLSKVSPDVNVLVINYDLLKKFFDELLKIEFELIGIDESHLCKTYSSIRTRCVRALARKTPYVVMLSATQVLNRPVELFAPLNILDPKTWNNYFRFTDRYCNVRYTRFGRDVSGASNIEELSQKLNKRFLRRRKEEVLPDLPAKVRAEVPVSLDGIYARDYAKAFDNFARFLRENTEKSDQEIRRSLQAEKIVRLNALRQIATDGKVDDAIEIIENIISSGAKINVFCSFNAPLERLAEHFGDKAVMITGKTSNEERFSIVERFQAHDSIKVFLGGILSAGVGVTLTKASHVLFLDRAWNQAAMKQAEDRAHRIGSEFESITIYTMHANNTVDDQMKKMLAKKTAVVEGLIGEGDDMTSFQMVLVDIEKQLKLIK